jgi:hypothetical protein
MGHEQELPPVDNGTPLHALEELRRSLAGDTFDANTAQVLHAVERASSAIIQSDSAKTIQEESRHLIRALAAAAQAFILAPRKVERVFDKVLDGFGRRIEILAKAGALAPDGLSERAAAQLDRVETVANQTTKNLEAAETRLRLSERALQEHVLALGRRRAWEATLLLLGILIGAALYHIGAIETRAQALLALTERQTHLPAGPRPVTSPQPAPTRRPSVPIAPGWRWGTT